MSSGTAAALSAVISPSSAALYRIHPRSFSVYAGRQVEGGGQQGWAG